MRTFSLLLCCLFTVFVLNAQSDRALQPAPGARRVALVIGNNAYRGDGRLTLARPDAEAVAADLPALGFRPGDIYKAYDTTLPALKKVIRDFVQAVGRGDLAFVYYSGHGVEVRGKNYLLPVEFNPDASELEVVDEAYSAQTLLELLESSGASARILILDACRNNPLRKRSIGRGLVGMDGSGTLVVFPTQAGKTTPDNGLFRRELLKGLRQRGISADDALKRIGRAVYQSSKGDQVPAIYGLLLEDFAFVPGAAAPIVNPGIPPVKPEPPTAIVTGPRQGDKKVGPDGQTYVYIAPATFQMGCSAGDNECDADEKPVTVTLTKGYWIGETEVTQEAYSKVTRQNPSHFEGPRRPVEQVNWEDAAAYCGKARMRLPTEAEWEYAARGGSGEAYFDDVSAIGWYSTNSGMETHEVKGKRANGYGLYDMQGNVWEWVQDWYVDRLAGGTDPRGPRSGERRVLRGGSWWGLPTFLRVSCRSRFVPSIRFELHGFRCAGE